MNRDERTVLLAIEKHSGEWSWYQLEHAVHVGGFEGEKRLMPVLKSLETSRYIETTVGHRPAQPLNSITELGRSALLSEEK